jgi:hypothetical protein
MAFTASRFGAGGSAVVASLKGAYTICGMHQLRMVFAYVVTYGFYGLMWFAFLFFLVAGGSALMFGGPLEDLPWPEASFNVVVFATGLGLLWFVARGFAEWSQPHREHLWDLYLEAEDPDYWVEVHRKRDSGE